MMTLLSEAEMVQNPKPEILSQRLAFRVMFAAKRKDHELSQRALAARLGVHQTAVSAWERGDNFPLPRHWRGIHDHLEIPLQELADFAVAFSPAVTSEVSKNNS